MKGQRKDEMDEMTEVLEEETKAPEQPQEEKAKAPEIDLTFIEKMLAGCSIDRHPAIRISSCLSLITICNCTIQRCQHLILSSIKELGVLELWRDK